MATDTKKIELKKIINEGGVDKTYVMYPKTVGSIVNVTDPTDTATTVEDTAELNTVLGNINKGFKSVVYKDGTISFFKEDGVTKDTMTSFTAVGSIDIPKEQFIDDADTKFIAKFDATEQAAYTDAQIPAADKATYLDKPVMILAVKTIAEDGTESKTYSVLDLSTMITTYTGVAATTTNPVGITIDSDGKISGSLEIKPDVTGTFTNALKLDSDGKLYVDDPTVSGGTENDVLTLDSNGKMQDSGIALVSTGYTELPDKTTDTPYTSIMEAITELNKEVALGSDGKISIENKGDVPGLTDANGDACDYKFSINHVDSTDVKALDASSAAVTTAGKIMVTTAEGKLVASDVAIDSISSSTVIDGKANKVTGLTEADHIATLTAEGDLADSGIKKEVIDLTGLQVLGATDSAAAGYYTNGTDTIAEALNEVKTIADNTATLCKALGINQFVATADQASFTTTGLTTSDLILWEI